MISVSCLRELNFPPRSLIRHPICESANDHRLLVFFGISIGVWKAFGFCGYQPGILLPTFEFSIKFALSFRYGYTYPWIKNRKFLKQLVKDNIDISIFEKELSRGVQQRGSSSWVIRYTINSSHCVSVNPVENDNKLISWYISLLA